MLLEFDRMDDLNDLDDLLLQCWRYLEEGADSARSPFHTAVLGTSADAGPRLRTVVLRGAERDRSRVYCHTDRRSAKVRQIGDGAPVSWLFYDPGRKVQLRLRGRACVHADDSLADERWRSSPAGSRRCYRVEPGPGAVLERPGSTLPEGLRARRPATEESEAGRGNFAVVAADIEFIDWLHLTTDGHRRAQFRRVGPVDRAGDGDDRDQPDHWTGEWIAP